MTEIKIRSFNQLFPSDTTPLSSFKMIYTQLVDICEQDESKMKDIISKIKIKFKERGVDNFFKTEYKVCNYTNQIIEFYVEGLLLGFLKSFPKDIQKLFLFAVINIVGENEKMKKTFKDIYNENHSMDRGNNQTKEIISTRIGKNTKVIVWATVSKVVKSEDILKILKKIIIKEEKDRREREEREREEREREEREREEREKKEKEEREKKEREEREKKEREEREKKEKEEREKKEKEEREKKEKKSKTKKEVLEYFLKILKKELSEEKIKKIKKEYEIWDKE
jgi:hypothetical protein